MIYPYFYKDHIQMSFPLYHHNGNFYLLIQRGMSFNIAVECHNSSNRFISNEDLCKFEELELNSDNLKKFLKALGKDSHADAAENGYLLYNNQLYHINDWRDVFNIIRN